MKKLRLLSVLALGAASVSALAGCGGASEGPAKDVKVGLICLHGAYSTYDNNFIIAMQAAKKKLGFELIIKQDIAEDTVCYDTAKSLAQQGCNIIFADSFGHEAHMIKAAKEFPDVLFCHATGTNGENENLDNFGDAFSSIYEGRYLAGVAGGLKLAALYGDGDGAKVSAENAKVGYVGAWTYAEVISGFTSFFLGVRSVVPAATMEVTYTSSWYDEDKEKAAAYDLIERGAKLISQHADSHGAPQACEDKKIPNVSYNGSTLSDGPNTYLISSRINWAPYYEKVIMGYVDAKAADKKPTVPNNFTGTLKDGSVEIDKCSKNCPEGAQKKVNEVKKQLELGELHVFDINNFKVNGETPTEENMRPNTNDGATWPGLAANAKFLEGGYYHESELRSAPSFDVIIDGITNLNTAF